MQSKTREWFDNDYVKQYMIQCKLLVKYWRAKVNPTPEMQNDFNNALFQLRHYLDKYGYKMPKPCKSPVDL